MKIDRFKGDYKDVVKNGKWVGEYTPVMWSDSDVFIIIDVETKKVAIFEPCYCAAGKGRGFRLEPMTSAQEDIGTFFYIEDEDKWIFVNW